jgi:hypothetical protein
MYPGRSELAIPESCSSIQTVKGNKNDCVQLMEQTDELLNAIIHFHIQSDTGGELPPHVLNHIGNFTEYQPYF